MYWSHSFSQSVVELRVHCIQLTILRFTTWIIKFIHMNMFEVKNNNQDNLLYDLSISSDLDYLISILQVISFDVNFWLLDFHLGCLFLIESFVFFLLFLLIEAQPISFRLYDFVFCWCELSTRAHVFRKLTLLLFPFDLLCLTY